PSTHHHPGAEPRSDKSQPSQPAQPPSTHSTVTSTSEESDSRTIIFRPTIVIIQNVFTIPAALLEQLQLQGALQSLVTVQNQEVFIFPNSIQVSNLGATYAAPTPTPGQSGGNSMPPFIR